MNPNEGRSARNGVATDDAREKLSAIIVALARPWIERLGSRPPLPAVEIAYQTCAVLWNATRLGDAAVRQAVFDRVSREVAAGAPPGSEATVSELIELLYQRALAAYPEDQRLVVKLHVEDLGDGSVRVDVSSTRPSGEA